jgi:hypothetical protein
MRRLATAIAHLALAASGVVAWYVLISSVLRLDASTLVVAVSLTQVVPLLLLANHFVAGFEGDAASGRRWGWALAALTWLPPLAVLLAYPYLEVAGARRRPNPYGIITDPPRRAEDR